MECSEDVDGAGYAVEADAFETDFAHEFGGVEGLVWEGVFLVGWGCCGCKAVEGEHGFGRVHGHCGGGLACLFSRVLVGFEMCRAFLN